MKVKSEREVAQSHPTLSDPMDCSLPGFSIHGLSRQEYWSGVPLPSPSLVTREMQIKISIRYNLKLVRMAKIKLSYCLVVEKAMAPHSSTLAWKIPWTEEPGGLPSMGSLGVGHDCVTFK